MHKGELVNFSFRTTRWVILRCLRQNIRCLSINFGTKPPRFLRAANRSKTKSLNRLRVNNAPFFRFLETFSPLSPRAKAAFEEVLLRQVCPKKTFLYRANEVCNRLYFVEKGILREYFLNEKDEEITNWLGLEHTLATSMYSFIARTPTQMHMQVLEDATLISVSYDDLQQLYERFHEIERLGRIVTEQYFLETEEIKRSFQYLSATQRYESLLVHQPELLRRIPLGYLASYLGISLETLSRIRAKK